MGFIRRFDISKINHLKGGDLELFARLKEDVCIGCVFPTITYH